MNIQDLLTLAIEAIFYCFTAFIALDIFICSYTPLPPIPKTTPQTLDDLEDDGIYNFGLALALSDLE
jgi:hypothetical protein